jgi:AcrR family transcriptional regulator
MAPETRMPALFPDLSERPVGLSPDRVAEHQKARLEGAMVAAVAKHGYAETTVRELVTLAGVSKSTFYNHFEDKQECFLATFEEIIAQLSQRVGEAYREPDDLRERLVSALSVFMRLAVDHPAAASLVAVDSLTLGAAGVEHRERASERFEVLMGQGLSNAPGVAEMPAQATRAIVSGVRGVAYWRLRAGTQSELPKLVDELVDWATGYLQPDGELTRRAVAAASEPAPPPPPADDSIPSWDEPPDSQRSRRALTQRQRIVRGAARVVLEKGFEGLSITGISSTAGVSNQTFYEHFAGKRDAFVAAFEELVGETVGVTGAAVAAGGHRPEALGVGIRALLESIAANEMFARIAFFELPMAGPLAMDRGDAVLDAFTTFLEPGTAPSEYERALPGAVREAIGAGVWGVLQHELHHGRRADLPQLAPEITRIALSPLEANQR